MAGVKKLSVALTPELAAMLEAAVETGDYASTSEVIREALRDWKEKQLRRDAARAEIRRLWQEGLDSGPPEDGEAVMARLEAKYRAMDGDLDAA
jgi:antitoxin ParD1/3/4